MRNGKSVLARRCESIYNRLLAAYGPPVCPLHYDTPFQLMVVAILSAQCTDVRVNLIAPALFARFPDAAAFAAARTSEVERLIKSAGLYRMKASNIIAASKILHASFGGQPPPDIEQLTTLPGVGRKTANVIVSHAYGQPGFAVDTHVNRLLNRMGVVNDTNPEAIEMRVRGLVPEERLSAFSLLLIFHGRKRCGARRYDCASCEVREWCDTGKKVKAG